MIYGLIMCAGNQTRFKDDLPKSLVKINDKCLLDINVNNLSKYCDKVFVVVSYRNQDYFLKYNKLIIDSGLGCGDAVFKALKLLNIQKNDTCFIQWGDCLHKEFIYSECIKNYNNKFLIPCTLETQPYVQIKENGIDSVKVLFSKFNDSISSGYHDLSLFYGNCYELLDSCNQFYELHWNGEKYIHKHNNEFSFLDIFNETNIKVNILEIKRYKSFDFNTVDEFKKLVKEYKF